MVRPWMSTTPAPTPQTKQVSTKPQSGPGADIAASTTAPPRPPAPQPHPSARF